MNKTEIFKLIEKERDRQEVIHPFPKRKNDQDSEVQALANLLANNEFLAVLVEEVGEVAQALQGDGDLTEELIQVASVAARWLENLE